jgi:hypothetical protein
MDGTDQTKTAMPFSPSPFEKGIGSQGVYSGCTQIGKKERLCLDDKDMAETNLYHKHDLDSNKSLISNRIHIDRRPVIHR